jgi:hypothetical protein
VDFEVLEAAVRLPIVLPGGRQLVTLEDAAAYIMKLPKAEQNTRRVASPGGQYFRMFERRSQTSGFAGS